jgi:hypothetical protein
MNYLYLNVAIKHAAYVLVKTFLDKILVFYRLNTFNMILTLRRKWLASGVLSSLLASGNRRYGFLPTGRGRHHQFALGIDRGFANPGKDPRSEKR